ncbi:MAG: ATP-dependent DNA helicase [Candidatus Korobacteraceae bacterium]
MRHSVKEQSAFVFDADAPREQTPTFVPTDAQREAIEHVDGPMLVVAGAGTGKTTVLTQRIARLLREGLAKPHEILAITYTRNSAHDLVVRLAEAWLGSKDERAVRQVLNSGVKVGTFHAYCYHLLCDARRRFELIDDQDLYVLLRRDIDELPLEHFINAGNLGQFLRDLLDFFRRCSDELRGPDDYDRYVADLMAGKEKPPRVCSSKQTLSDNESIARCREIAGVFRRVDEKLAVAGMGTYGDVISRALALLDDANPEWLHRAQEGARFLLIDEFQDSNVAQIKLAKRLAGNEANVFAVGDPDQAIYRFRGATSGAFDQFLAAFGPGRVKRVTMRENRRSTQAVLSNAYQVIAQNPEIATLALPGSEKWQRLPLIHARTAPEPAPVPPVRVRGCIGKGSEAAFVVTQIERMHKAGRPWRDFAVLYRQHSHRDDVVRLLREHGIPFEVEGVSLIEITQIRDLLAAIRFIQSSDAVSAVRVASLSQYEVDGAALRTAFANAGDNLQAEAELAKLNGGEAVLTALSEARRLLASADGKAKAAVAVAHQCFAMPRDKNCEAFAEFVDRWAKKPAALSGEGTLGEFLEYLELFIEGGGKVCRPEDDGEGTPVTLLMESGKEERTKEAKDAVRLMTAHQAKGLEFPVVFVVRVGSQTFPAKYQEELVEFPGALRNRENLPEDDPKSLHEQEERRLFYVAVTRAEDELFLTGRPAGKKDLTPAGYLRELVALKTGPLSGQLEFLDVPEGTLLPTVHAGTAALPRVHAWMALPPLDTTRILRLSPSAIESYSYCPLRFKLERDWNLPEEPGAAMQFGSAIHTALMGYFDAQRKGKSLDAETVIASFLDEFAKAKIDEPLQRELFEKKGRRQLIAFLNSPAAKPHGRVAMIEQRIELNIAGAKVTGRIDRVDEDEDGLTVIDYKTGRAKTQKHADESLQLSIYALGLNTGKPVKAVVFENLEDGSTMVATRNSRQLSKAEEEVVEAAENIKAGNFEPKTGFHCNWCAYRALCPEQELVLITKN